VCIHGELKGSGIFSRRAICAFTLAVEQGGMLDEEKKHLSRASCLALESV
jgi:hypothetical protein